MADNNGILASVPKPRCKGPGKGHFAEDLSGRRFSHLLVLGRSNDYVTSNGNHYAQWRCRCDCGNEVDVIGGKLRDGSKISCGCIRRPRKKLDKNRVAKKDALIIDKSALPKVNGSYELAGVRFGRLVPVQRADNYTAPSGSTFTRWLCECDCGANVVVTTTSLLSGHTQSCGCLQRDVVGENGRLSEDDLTGRQFGEWTVLHRSFDDLRMGMWLCRCSCGVERAVRGTALRTGASASCGCAKASVPDLAGQMIAHWKVISRAPNAKIRDREYRVWMCECECGTVRNVFESGLMSGGTCSCGCVGAKAASSRGEQCVIQYCDSHGIKFRQHVTYDDLRGTGGGRLSYDFLLYVDDEPFCLIECQGQQHYKPVELFGGEEQFERQMQHDFLKREYAMSINLPLFEMPYTYNTEMAVSEFLDPILHK